MKKYSSWLIWVILAVALILRLPLLNGSFWLDEAAQALESSRPWSEQLQLTDDFQPPLLHLITAVSIRFSMGEWWLRTWGALIPGILTIFVVYKIGELIGNQLPGGKWLGLVAALLLATSSFHIYYSQELRPYSLSTLWAVITWFLIIKMQKVSIGQKGWWQLGAAWVFTSLLGLYSSYLYPFLMISQLAVIKIQWLKQFLSDKKSTLQQVYRAFFHWLALITLVILGFLPWLPKFIDQLATGQTLRLSMPGWESVVSTPQLKALVLVGGKFLFGVSDLSFNYYFLISILIFIITLFLVLRQFKHWLFLADNKKSRDIVSNHLLALLTWLVLPLVIAWSVSFVVPVLQPKRVLYLLPAFYLLVAILITPLVTLAKTWKQRFWPLVLFNIILFFNLSSTLAYWLNPQLQRENWRELYFELKNKYELSTPKLFIFDAPFAPWIWYDSQHSGFSMVRDFSLISARTADKLTATSIVTNATAEYSKPKIIYFEYLTDLTDPKRLVINELQTHGYLPTDLLNYPQIGFIRIFEK